MVLPRAQAVAVTTPLLGSGSCDWALAFLIHGHIIPRLKVKTNAFIALSKLKSYVTNTPPTWLSGNATLTNGALSTTLSVPMKRSPWQCRRRAINLVAVAILNSYRQSNMARLTLFAKSATMVTSNMKAGSTMSAVPSMVFMSLYVKPP